MRTRAAALLGDKADLSSFANGYLYYGIARTEDGWVYREWAPGADEMHLIGDFNDWQEGAAPLTRKGRSGRASCRTCRSTPLINTRCGGGRAGPPEGGPLRLPHGDPAGDGQQAVRHQRIQVDGRRFPGEEGQAPGLYITAEYL